MPTPLALALARSRLRQPGRLLREFTLLILAAASVTYLAAVFPALDFHYTAAFQYARFSAVIKTGGGRDIPQRVIARAVPGARSVTMRSLMGEARAAGTWKPLDAWVIREDDLDLLGATFFSDATRSSGSIGPGSLGLGLGAAGQLQVVPGDDVTVRFTTDRNEEVTLESPATAFWRPMDGLDGVLLPLPNTAFAKLSAAAQSTHIFITTRKPLTAAELSGLERVAADAEGAVLTPPGGVLDARQRMNRSFSRNTAYGTVAVALLVYLAFAWRSLSAVMRQRERTHAILMSFGTPVASVAASTAAEQTLVSIVALVAGGQLARVAMWKASQLYVPRESLLVLGGVMAVLAVGSALLAVLVASWRLKRIPVARLLTSSPS